MRDFAPIAGAAEGGGVAVEDQPAPALGRTLAIDGEARKEGAANSTAGRAGSRCLRTATRPVASMTMWPVGDRPSPADSFG
jgi:hypothetical protein